MSIKKIKKLFEDSADLKLKILKHKSYLILEEMSNAIVKSIQNDGKLLICGNGGSAADAQHLAAELLIRLRPNKNRKSLPALALALDTSTITACGNDYGFNNIYKRIIESIGKKNDVLLVISTSGNSPNILNALKAAKKKNIICLGFLGSNGGKASKLCKSFIPPSNVTGRIQESHITAGHALMESIEDKLLKNKYLTLKKRV